jgi:hypothetical protein
MTDDAIGHLLHNIFATPDGPGPPYTHTFDPSPPDPAEAVAWLREQVKMDHNRWRATLAQVRPVEAGGITVLPGGFEALAQFEDAQDHVADCEAKLAILDEHAAVWDDYRTADGDESDTRECETCEPPGTPDNYPCRTVRFLASAYRHRDGYDRYWGTPSTHTITEDGP